MAKDEASRFRGLVARVNYLSLVRPDSQFAAKTVSQHMGQPNVCDWAKIKLIARYFVKASRLSKSLCVSGKPTQFTTYVDSESNRSWRCRAARPSSAACSKDQTRLMGAHLHDGGF